MAKILFIPHRPRRITYTRDRDIVIFKLIWYNIIYNIIEYETITDCKIDKNDIIKMPYPKLWSRFLRLIRKGSSNQEASRWITARAHQL